MHVDHHGWMLCWDCWYSLQGRAAPASLAHHAPPAAPVGRGDLGIPSHRVSLRPQRAQGSRAHPECLAVGKGERCRGVSSCRGSKGGSCRAAVGFGDTLPAPHLSPVPLVLAHPIHPGDGGHEKGDGEAEEMRLCCGGRQLCPFPDGGVQRNSAQPQEHSPTAGPYLLTLHPCKAVDTGVSLEKRGQEQ